MNLADLETRISRINDIEAIRQLKANYFFCCDQKDLRVCVHVLPLRTY